VIVLALLLLGGGALGVYQIVYNTPDGTLVVELSDKDTEARFKAGDLELYRGDKKIYTLVPLPKKPMPPGDYKVKGSDDYQIKVIGADGLEITTKEFTLNSKDQVTVRVTFRPPQPIAKAGPKPGPKADAIDYAAERKSAAGLKALGGKLHAAKLRRADGSEVNWKPGEALPDGPFSVEQLELKKGELTDADLPVIAACARLRDLDLFNAVQITDKGLTALKSLHHLRHLNLTYSPVGDGLAEVLAANPELEALHLDGDRITDAGLAGLKHCPKLRAIQLPQKVGRATADLLAEHCKQLEVLDAGYSFAFPLKPLAALPGLRQVRIPGELLKDDENLAALAAMPKLENLAVDPPMDDDRLARLKPLAGKLRRLDVISHFNWDPGVTPEGWKALDGFDQLEELQIGGEPGTKTALDGPGLLRLAGLKKLKCLGAGFKNVDNQKYTAADIEAFRRKRPDVFLIILVGDEQKAYPAQAVNAPPENKADASPPLPSRPGLQFGDKSTYVEFPTLRMEKETSTVEVWLTAQEMAPFQLVSSFGGNYCVAIHTADGRRWGAYYTVNGKGIIVFGSAANKNELVHLAAVRDGAAVRFFVNGKAYTEQTDPNDSPERVAAVQKAVSTLGAWKDQALDNSPTRQCFFRGTLHALRVSNKARYQANFTPEAHFQRDDATVALYQFEEGSGDGLKDSSGNKHHGKIVGAKWVKAIAAINYEAERKAAEGLKALGGKLQAAKLHRGDGSEVNWKPGDALPGEPFTVAQLELKAGELTDADLPAITACAWLRDLNLAGAKQLTDKALLSLKALHHLRRLNLDLDETAVGDGLAEVLAANPDLEFLSIGNGTISDEGLAAGLKNCPHLRELLLPGTAARATAEALGRHCKELQVLHVAGVMFVLKPLAGLPSLEQLNIPGGLLEGDDNVAALAAMPKLKGMFVSSPTTDAVVARLKPLAGKLRILGVFSWADWDPGVTADGWKALDGFDQLENLHIGGTPGTKSVLDGPGLLRLAGLKKLKQILVGFPEPAGQKYTAADVEAFRSKRPDVSLSIFVGGQQKYYPAADSP
jgi:hypothetical protein